MNKLDRIAIALERIANALEHKAYPIGSLERPAKYGETVTVRPEETAYYDLTHSCLGG